VLFSVHLERMCQKVVIYHLPAIVPAVCHLWRLAMACRSVEAKFTCWRDGLFVKLCNAGREAYRFRGLLTYLAEFGQEEVVGRPWAPVLPPGKGFWAERRQYFVDSLVGLELAFTHYPVAFAGSDLANHVREIREGETMWMGV